jgi:hypothetical protein
MTEKPLDELVREAHETCPINSQGGMTAYWKDGVHFIVSGGGTIVECCSALHKPIAALAAFAESEGRRADGFAKMMSCENYDGGETNKCAEETPDPPGIGLHRCMSCQILKAQSERAAAEKRAEEARIVHNNFINEAEACIAELEREVNGLRAALTDLSSVIVCRCADFG